MGVQLAERVPGPYAGSRYPQILRSGLYSPVLGVVGVLLGASVWILGGTLVGQLVLRAAYVVRRPGEPFGEYAKAAQGFAYWEGMLAAHLTIALLIPITWALVVWVHRLSGRWLVSVWGAVRWRYLVAMFGVATVVFAAYIGSMPLLGRPLVRHPQPHVWVFLLVIVLTSPFQALAEEVFFRGHVLQALGGFLRTPWVGIVGSALVFAVFHGAQNLPLFLSRFVFGLLAAWLVVRTGGLEAGVAAHVVNNLFAFGLAALTSSVAEARQMTTITWVSAFLDVAVFAVYAVLAALVAKVLRVPDTVPDRLGVLPPSDLPDGRSMG